MKFEYELYGSIEDLLLVAANSFSFGMQHISTLFLYGDYVLSYHPLPAGEGDESLWLISLAKGKLPIGLIELDTETKKIEKITRAVNPEKSHFLVIKPEKSTVLEKALGKFKQI